MDVTCVSCGGTFQAKSPRARYCSDRCRKRRQRSGGKAAEVIALLPAPGLPPGPVTVATITELKAAERFESALGQACVALAMRLDRPGVDTGSAVAAVAARLDDLLAKATKGTGRKTAPQQLRDDLAERRAKHGA